MTATERSENPNAIALAFRGEREKKAKQPATLPRCVHAIAPDRKR
jgi:hypothetical protein